MHKKRLLSYYRYVQKNLSSIPIKCTSFELKYLLVRTYMDMDILQNKIPIVCEEVHRKRKMGETDKKHPYKDYPSVLSECCKSDFKHPMEYFFAKSAQKPWNTIKYFKSKAMLYAMDSIGGLGNKSEKESWRIGNCAEQRVGELLLQDDPQYDIGKITFSTAIRPRTNEVIQYCDNCRRIFKMDDNPHTKHIIFFP